MFPRGLVLAILTTVLIKNVVTTSEVDIIKGSVADLMDCWMDNEPTNCLEARTIRSVHELNEGLAKDLPFDLSDAKRSGKLLEKGGGDNAIDTEGMDPLELENKELMRKIAERKSAEPRGLVDEIGDLFTSLTFRFLNPFTGDGSDDDTSDNSVEEEDDGQLSYEERGHKKKELKKKNKQLKLILLLMLFKNKVKMFVNKLQFLVQLKFLLVATINMLANVFRLWIELKKKHKPNKVVYYENAHHQHHYDHEHIHDHDDGHYSHPGSYSHHAHHEEEDYGGGPWPWSRSYVEKQGEHAFQRINAYRRYPGSHTIVYSNQRPLR